METLFILALLACPVGMGLMMWFMARGMKTEEKPDERPATVAELRERQARLEAELERLDGKSPNGAHTARV